MLKDKTIKILETQKLYPICLISDVMFLFQYEMPCKPKFAVYNLPRESSHQF